MRELTAARVEGRYTHLMNRVQFPVYLFFVSSETLCHRAKLWRNTYLLSQNQHYSYHPVTCRHHWTSLLAHRGQSSNPSYPSRLASGYVNLISVQVALPTDEHLHQESVYGRRVRNARIRTKQGNAPCVHAQDFAPLHLRHRADTPPSKTRLEHL